MFIADTHCDSISFEVKGTGSLVSKYNAPKGQHLQVYAMFCEFPWQMPPHYIEAGARDGYEIKDGGDLLNYYIDKYYDTLKKYTFLRHANCYGDVEKALNEGKSVGLISVEGCNSVDSLEKLNALYEKGVRLAGLTWNQKNIIGCGAEVSRTSEDTGLTGYGKEFIKECDRLGIVVDLSHSSDKTVDDVLSLSSKAVIASHSNFRDVCDCNRNLMKAHSDEIVRRGGYIGLNLCDGFVTSKKDVPYVSEMLLPHADYALENGYADSIGFGFDIDGISLYPSDISMEESIHERYVELFSERYGEPFAEKAAGANFLRFYKAFCENKI